MSGGTVEIVSTVDGLCRITCIDEVENNMGSVAVKANDLTELIMPGDNLWWMKSSAFWTPQTGRITEEMLMGHSYQKNAEGRLIDIILEKVGPSFDPFWAVI